MMVAVPVVGKIGDRIASYFGEFGNLEGHISDTTAGGFLLELSMSGAMREKFASKLTWLESKLKDPGVQDGRKQARIIPASPHSTLTFADGAVRSCFVIDMSVSGAAVCAEVQPPIGMPLAVGACVGRVVRHLPDGFAVKFVEQQNRGDLERRVVRPAPLLSAGGAKAALRTSRATLAPSSSDATPAPRLDGASVMRAAEQGSENERGRFRRLRLEHRGNNIG